jgi:hypothetical protein
LQFAVVLRTPTLKMDFPDPEEEFDLLYADELEVMRELEGRVSILQFVDV